MKSTRRLSQRDVNSLTFNCATWLFSAVSPWSSTHARSCVNNALHACTCVELTDGPIPLAVVPGIRNAINIITFDYTGRRARGVRKRKRTVSLSLSLSLSSLLVFQAIASICTRLRASHADTYVCILNILPSFQRLDLLTLLRQQE